MHSRVHAGCLVGIEARPVEVEVHLGKGLPGFDIVGLPEAAVKESRVRVRAALAVGGYELPPRHVVLNLAPADLKKRGASFDLAIAVAVLSANGMCAPNLLGDTLLVGELSLAGELRAVRGVLPLLAGARDRGLERAIVPLASAAEAQLATDLDVRTARTLDEVVGFLSGEGELPRARDAAGAAAQDAEEVDVDLGEVRGQESARRAIEIAAAGGHHVLLVGPPGAGKTMLARRLPGVLPRPTDAEQRAIATIASAAGFGPARPGERPFRAPHHTASAVALVGGGDPVRPGEVTLAHAGVLFLDELPEFHRAAIESLRTTMESGVAVVARVRDRVTMPARPLVVAAMNPCPCGYAGDSGRMCTCAPARIEAYRARISGPLLDRFDLQVWLPPVRVRELGQGEPAEPSRAVRQRVVAARRRAAQVEPEPTSANPARTFARDLEALAPEARPLLERAGESLGLSMRGLARALRVARTISHLEGSDRVQSGHVAEALQYRLFDRPASVPAVERRS